MTRHSIFITAAAARDAVNINVRPGAVLVRDAKIAAVGTPEVVSKQCDCDTQNIDLPDSLILPSMVNAHAHLELSGIRPFGYGGDFIDWVKSVIKQSPQTTAEHELAVRRGISYSVHGGSRYVGDITRSASTRSLRGGNTTDYLPGVSYLECFGIGNSQAAAISELEQTVESQTANNNQISLGIQPHAPYSAGAELYATAAKLARRHDLRLTTHLAETLEEIQFVRDASGPFCDLLKSMNKWDDSIQPTGLHPIEWLYPRLAKSHWLLAHCNYLDDHHIELLADSNTSVAYCPVASDYFGHRGHRYRDMIDAGVNVCLGTDSLICQPSTADQPLGILPQMRHLYRRDGTDPSLLLRMATTNGARALKFQESIATLQPGSPSTLTAIKIDPQNPADPLTQALINNEPLTPLMPTN